LALHLIFDLQARRILFPSQRHKVMRWPSVRCCATLLGDRSGCCTLGGAEILGRYVTSPARFPAQV
jgi:hypothetical protein